MKIKRIVIPENEKCGYTNEWIDKLNGRLVFVTDIEAKYTPNQVICRRANTVFDGNSFWVNKKDLKEVTK